MHGSRSGDGDDNTAAEEDYEEEDNNKNNDNNKDNNHDKGYLALGLDRDEAKKVERCESKNLSESKKTPVEQLALLSPDRGFQF